MTSGYAVLIGQLRQFLVDLEQIVARSQCHVAGDCSPVDSD